MATEQELKDIASQLRCPNGEHGVMVGDNMNETNIMMTKETIGALNLHQGEHILELGPGNAGHLPGLLDTAAIRYVGLDISSTMLEEATKLNKDLVARSIARFDLYDGKKTPYEDGQFDKAFTVNTLYFWEDPKETFTEIARILKPQGVFLVTFASKQFMQTLPFTSYGFTLYNQEDVIDLTKDSPFYVKDILNRTETVRSKIGDVVDRAYHIAILAR